MQRNLEEVEATIDDIERERTEKQKKGFFRTLFGALIFPFAALWRAIKKLVRKIRIPLAMKTTLIFTALFAVILTVLAVVMVASMEDKLSAVAGDDYILNLKLTTAAIVVMSVIVVGALGRIFSGITVRPIRKMIKQIDRIDPAALDIRLDSPDSQDEIAELTARINELLDRVSESNKRQQKFVADASHELKTPISVIKGYASMLARWGKDDKAVLDEGVDSILRESENMGALVERLLFLAGLGKYSVNLENVNMRRLLGEVVDAYALIDDKHNFSLLCDGRIYADVDRSLLTECVRALVDNAVKYTADGGKITVLCRVGLRELTVSVSDTGIGIAKEDLPKIFDRFYRCDRSRHREKSGIGLGLTIALTIAELMGGRIEVESEEGKGTDFTIIIPNQSGRQQ